MGIEEVLCNGCYWTANGFKFYGQGGVLHPEEPTAATFRWSRRSPNSGAEPSKARTGTCRRQGGLLPESRRPGLVQMILRRARPSLLGPAGFMLRD